MSNLKELSPKENLQIAKKVGTESLRDFSIVTDEKYEPEWFHDLLADTLQGAYERVMKGESVRIMLSVPPRHGKSELATKKFPAWVLGKSPEIPFIVASYGQTLADKFGSDTRDIMNSPSYQNIFNTRLRADTKAKATWMTEEGGGYKAVGVGGGITGMGFKIGIIDDPIKDDEESESEVIRDKVWDWYKTTFYTRQEGANAIIVIQTRWHDDDLTGRLIAEQKRAEEEGAENYDKWEKIVFPAVAERDEKHRKEGEPLWPQKFPIEQLEVLKRTLGPYKWSALYQQNPVDEESQEFKQFWFKYRSERDVMAMDTRKFLTIDPASAMRGDSDNIGAVLNFVDKENKWNIMSWKLRLNAPDLINFIFKVYIEYEFEKVGIEEGVYQQVLKPYLDEEMRKRNTFFQVVELKHQRQNKLLRIRGLVPYYSSGSVYHIEGTCLDLEEEQVRFPRGAHDDVVDAEAYQLQLAEAPRENQYIVTEPVKPYYGDGDLAF